MDPDVALALLDRAVAAGETALVVADVDWGRFARTYGAARRRPLLDLVPGAVTDPGPTAAAGAAPALRLDGLGPAERREAVLDLVTTQASAVLGFDHQDELDPARAFRDLGVDSLTAVDLRDALARATGLSLPTTLVFDHPNAGALAEHLERRLAPAAEPDGADGVAAGLDRLERAVAAREIPEADRDRVAERLQLLLLQLGGDARAADRGPAPRLDPAAASDDDLFAFIDDHLGGT
jgi:acyl carrier protein